MEVRKTEDSGIALVYSAAEVQEIIRLIQQAYEESSENIIDDNIEEDSYMINGFDIRSGKTQATARVHYFRLIEHYEVGKPINYNYKVLAKQLKSANVFYDIMRLEALGYVLPTVNHNSRKRTISYFILLADPLINGK